MYRFGFVACFALLAATACSKEETGDEGSTVDDDDSAGGAMNEDTGDDMPEPGAEPGAGPGQDDDAEPTAGPGPSPEDPGPPPDPLVVNEDVLAPSDFTAVALFNGNHLEWVDEADDETGYEVQVSLDGASFQFLARMGADITSFHHQAGLAPGDYVYRVRTIRGEEASEWVTASLTVEEQTGPSPSADDDVSGDDDVPPGDDDVPPGDDDVPPGDDDVTPPEDDDATPPEDDDVPPPDDDAPPPDDDVTPPGDDDVPPGPQGPVSFRNDLVPLFEASCGTTTSGCHTRESYWASADWDCRGWLALEDEALGSESYAEEAPGVPTNCPDATLYERLTTHTAWMCGPPAVDGAENIPYVTPGDPQNSFLYLALGEDPVGRGNCEKTPGEPTTRMPLEPLPALPQADIDMIRRWIEEGALDN